jgi:hypothetical protein
MSGRRRHYETFRRPLGPRTRENAALLCATRASAEADPDFCIGNRSHASGRSRRQHVWTPEGWTKRERELAMRAFYTAIERNGVGMDMAPVNWAEAEAMIRCGEIE